MVHWKHICCVYWCREILLKIFSLLFFCDLQNFSLIFFLKMLWEDFFILSFEFGVWNWMKGTFMISLFSNFHSWQEQEMPLVANHLLRVFHMHQQKKSPTWKASERSAIICIMVTILLYSIIPYLKDSLASIKLQKKKYHNF